MVTDEPPQPQEARENILSNIWENILHFKCLGKYSIQYLGKYSIQYLGIYCTYQIFGEIFYQIFGKIFPPIFGVAKIEDIH